MQTVQSSSPVVGNKPIDVRFRGPDVDFGDFLPGRL
jgi:hypothetical protein